MKHVHEDAVGRSDLVIGGERRTVCVVGAVAFALIALGQTSASAISGVVILVVGLILARRLYVLSDLADLVRGEVTFSGVKARAAGRRQGLSSDR